VQFAQPVRVDKIILRNGSSDDYTATTRAEKIRIVFAGTDKKPQFTADDVGDPKTYTLHNAVKVKKILIEVLSEYPALGPSRQLAITEISFFQKK
jgi:hypothetical protein